MNQAATVQALEEIATHIDFDLLGTFYYNPTPPLAAPTVINGKPFPGGSQGVVVGGKHYMIPPQQVLRIERSNKDHDLVVLNLERMVGKHGANDWGITRIDWPRFYKEKGAYLERIDKDGANRILATIRRTVIEALDKENEARAARNIPKREYNHAERIMLAMFDGLSSRLTAVKANDRQFEIDSAREAATKPPEFATGLLDKSIQQLRRQAKILGMVGYQNLSKDKLIGAMNAFVEDQQRRAMEQAGVEPLEPRSEETEAEEPEDDTVSLNDDEARALGIRPE